MRLSAAIAAVAVVGTACGGSESVTPTTATSATQTTAALPTTTPAQTVTSPTVPILPSTPTTTAAPAATSTVTPDTVPDPGSGEFATFDPPPADLNWLRVSVRGGASLAEQPELCLLLNDGEEGHIRAQNIGLEWLPGEEWTLIWNYVGGVYNGPVEGAVDGMTVTFHGESEGVEVQGSVICFEP